MINTHEKLKAYLYKITNGLIRLKEEHTAEIDRIVRGPNAYAKLSKWSGQSGLYEHTFTETTSDADIDYIVNKYKDKKPVINFAKWELYDSEGSLKGIVYTTSHVLNYLLL